MPWGTGPGRPIPEGLRIQEMAREKLGPLRAAAGRIMELAKLVEGFKLELCKAKLCKISRELLRSSEDLLVANKALDVMRDNNKASQRGKKRISNLLRSSLRGVGDYSGQQKFCTQPPKTMFF
jgi:hypothetical protein